MTRRAALFFSAALVLFGLCQAVEAELSREAIWAGEIEQLVRTKGIFPLPEPLPRDLQGPAFFASLEDFFRSYDGGTSYFIPGLRSFKRSYGEGEQKGLGLRLRPDGERCCLFTTKPGTPAARAGIPKEGLLLRVDGKDIASFNLTALAAVLEEKGDEALLLEFSTGPDEPPIGAIVAPETIESKKPAWNEIGEFRALSIPHFRTETRFEVERLLSELKADEPLIIDLRNNTGGSARSAIRIACLFMKRDTAILRERSRDKTRERFCRWRPVAELHDRRVMILQDESTASSAELFIAAMNIRERTRTLGSRTFGKGVKSTLLRLSGGAGLLLSTSEYLTADGAKIHGAGLEPDRRIGDSSNLETALNGMRALWNKDRAVGGDPGQ